MNKFPQIIDQLKLNPSTWLVTGCAGFIGSNLIEALLKIDQTVIGIDNFSTGYKENLNQVSAFLSEEQLNRFKFIEGDISKLSFCQEACHGVDFVLHQAALGSVPRSIKNPIASNQSNISGHLNMLVAAKDNEVKSFTYAASSSTYGDHPDLPKVEENIGNPLSPYAVTKLVNELYASIFSLNHQFHSIGLRYFNVFGKRQDPNGAYAAVIPRWINGMINGEQIFINGDGSTSRDFCHIENVIQANILAATHTNLKKSEVFNVAVGDRTSLNDLFKLIQGSLAKNGIAYKKSPEYRDFREGDVKHSQADISKAKEILGFNPEFNIQTGISQSVKWFIEY
jgi:UDP-N-acetylglucosamine/UDP-N-acetylgalactosamine 4-epimerase